MSEPPQVWPSAGTLPPSSATRCSSNHTCWELKASRFSGAEQFLEGVTPDMQRMMASTLRYQ